MLIAQTVIDPSSRYLAAEACFAGLDWNIDHAGTTQEVVMAIHFTDHAANERTFLAWVRTAIAVVGFGLAVGRLGDRPPSAWSEVALLLTGGIVIVLSYCRMQVQRRRINSPEGPDDASSPVDLLLLGLVLSLFALMASFTLHLL